MRFERLLLIPVVLASVACIEGQRLIKVRADGSGTIMDTVTLGEQAREMLGAMAGMDETPAAGKKAKQDAKLKARAQAMGPGVSLVAFVPGTRTSPEKLSYAFKDITKIRIEPSADSAENDSQEVKNPLTFRFEKKASGALLTVMGVSPKPDANAEPPATPTKEAAEAAAKMEAQALVMMKTMLKGLKMTTLVEVEGKLLRTSSPWSEGSTVTVLAIDFDQVAADEASLKKLSAMSGDPSSVDPAALAGIKGIKAQPTPELTIEFAR